MRYFWESKTSDIECYSTLIFKVTNREMLQQLYSNYEMLYCFHIILTMYAGAF